VNTAPEFKARVFVTITQFNSYNPRLVPRLGPRIGPRLSPRLGLRLVPRLSQSVCQKKNTSTIFQYIGTRPI
jgi:hypothetical protein